MQDLDRLIVETATAVVGYRDDFDFTAWHTRWSGAGIRAGVGRTHRITPNPSIKRTPNGAAYF